MQFAVREELLRGMADFRAKGVTGIVMDAKTGELVAMVSVPDFDPNRAGDTDPDARFNRATLGVFEPGSTMKVMTVAMALELGTAKLDEKQKNERKKLFGTISEGFRPLRPYLWNVSDQAVNRIPSPPPRGSRSWARPSNAPRSRRTPGSS